VEPAESVLVVLLALLPHAAKKMEAEIEKATKQFLFRSVEAIV
jgi:hypothetical protein